MSSEKEKVLLFLAFALGLIVEFFGVFLGIWWYKDPSYMSILHVLSMSFSYSLLIWLFTKGAIVFSKAKL